MYFVHSRAHDRKQLVIILTKQWNDIKTIYLKSELNIKYFIISEYLFYFDKTTKRPLDIYEILSVTWEG